MAETLIWSFLLRFLQSLFSAAPFILAGLIIAGVFRRLMGRDLTVRMFGDNSRRSLVQAWGIGMLLPICSLGVIPVIRELRRTGLKGGTILAFAMSAPLFNPLSVLYGLTLSEPWAIITFAFCSLLVVTGVGFVWDRIFPDSGNTKPPPAEVAFGLKRMLSIAVAAGREAGGVSAIFILIGLIGVAMLGVIIPAGGLQHAMNGDNPFAPLTMSGVAVPVYATPMLAMSQLGMMFQHANSPGAAFVLLVLGAGMNLGLAAWMWRQYGLKKCGVWFALLLAIVLGLAYGVDRPLYPHEIDAADHTHAFDIYCRPFHGVVPNASQVVIEKLKRDIQPYELYASIALGAVVLFGLILNLFDRNCRIEAWLEKQQETAEPSRFDIIVPAPVLGGLFLVGLVFASILGCYAYYPPPGEVLEEMNIAKAEALGAALVGDEVHSKYWIDIYQDWSRKLEVGVYLRDWKLSDYHRIKSRILREQLELLKHEVEHYNEDKEHGDNHAEYEDTAEIRELVSKVNISQVRLKTAFLDER
ncbi:permease [Thalassoglobus sp. JC818]|uniref:permease n=1 Tax=Thalassoglobus sp. JC818 TaxID=3232136 RepID=UPI0034595AAB